MDLFVTFIGTAASVPTAARGTAATLIARGGARWLVDCGEGTQRQFLRSGLGLPDVDAVLLTHLHGDHYLGLPGLLKTYGLRGREHPLVVGGPPGLASLVERLRLIFGRTPFPIELAEWRPGAVVRADGARIEAFATDHTVRSLGYALVEDARPGEFHPDAARDLGVPEGPLFGRLQRGEEIALDDGRRVRPDQVLGPPRAGRRLVLTGDTRPCRETARVAEDATLLVHESTFLDEDRDRAVETGHSTAREAAALAQEAGVRLLALTHLSSRCLPREVRREAEREFPHVVVPRDFDQIEIPFPERGEPRLLRARRAGETEVAPSAEPATVPADDL